MKASGSLNSFLSYAPQLSGANPVYLFTSRSGRWLLLVFPQLFSSHRRGWQLPLDGSSGTSHSHLEARNRWWLWHFLFIHMAGDIFISHKKSIYLVRASLVAQRQIICLQCKEMRVWSLGLKEFLEEEMATHYSILAWEIPWTEECHGLQPMVLQKNGTRLSN